MDEKAKICLQVKSGSVKLMARVLEVAHAAVLVKYRQSRIPPNVGVGAGGEGLLWQWKNDLTRGPVLGGRKD